MFKRNGLVILLVFGLVFLASCTRSSVEDPDMTGGAGFRIQVSGTASPSVLYVPEHFPSVYSDITARVLKNDGSPAVNYTVIFQTDMYGYFDNYKISDTRSTDGGGNARIRFFIPPGTRAIGDTRIDIKATVVDDGRNDIPILSEIYDNIPIRIIPYDAPKEMVVVSGSVFACSGSLGLPGVVITFSNGGGLTVSRSSGSYDIYVPWGWTGDIEAELEGFSFTPQTITIVSPLYTDKTGQDFFGTASDSGLVANPSTFEVGVAGATDLEVWVGSVDNVCDITYRVDSGADWIDITSAVNGTTPSIVTFDVIANGTTNSRSGEISIISITAGVISEVIITINQEG
ncbi:MAG: BACON domain-containing protein [Candidatus Aminicenantes bacterium]|nr:BACON domain-containing protein [Candidatus Aminicenantes bacterium]